MVPPDLSPIDLNLSEEFKDEEFTYEFFRSLCEHDVAEQIRNLREKIHLRQSDLAAKCEMKQSAVSRIEDASYAKWNFNTLWRIAKALKAVVRIHIEPAETAIRRMEVRAAAHSNVMHRYLPTEMD